MVLCLTQITVVSAWEWDNKITYTEKDMKVAFENARGLPFIGSKLGEIKLSSHRNVEEIKRVNVGEDKTVMYYDFKGWKLYDGGLGEVIFTDETTGEEIEKEYYFAKAIYETKSYPIYNPRCEDGEIREECKTLISNNIETHLIGWERLDTRNIPKEDITIGLVTDVKEGDYIDAQWIIAGRKVSKHASWEAGSLLDGLVSAWKMDSTGTAIDGSGINDCTKAGDVVDNNVTAFFGTSYSFDGNTDGLDCGNDQSSNMTTAFSICSIVFPSNVAGGNKRIINKHWTSSHTSPFFSYYMATVGDIRFGAAVEGAVKEFTAGAVVINQPNWVCGTFNGTTLVAYINGSEVGSLAAVGKVFYGGQRNLFIGSNEHNTEDFEGSIDETFLWNRSLTATEISDWYNDGNGLEFITANPNVTINQPTNDTFTTATTEFNITCISDLGIESANYTINDGADNFTLVNNGGNEWTDTNITMAQGGYKAEFSCYDPDGGVNNSESVDFTIAFAPIVTITSPDTGNNFTTTDIEINNTITFQISQACKYSDDGGLTNNSLVCGQNISYVASQGQTNFTIFANSSNGNEGSDTIWLFVDSIPPDVNLSSPLGNISYHVSGNNLTLNWSISGNLGSCWWTNNSGINNNSVPCLDLNLSFIANVFNSKEVTLYTNDTLGNENSSSTGWDYLVFENSQTFNTTGFELEGQTITINLSSVGGATVSANLFYKDEFLTGTKVGNNNEMEFSRTLGVPSGVGNNTFYWNITHGSDFITTTMNNQTISPTIFGICNSTLTQRYLNVTFKNETLLEEDINATISSSFTYWLADQAANKTGTYSNATEQERYSFCFTPTDRSMNLRFEAQYNNQISQQRTFINTFSLSNSTLTSQVLYLLPTALGIFSTFQTIDSISNPISAVDSTMTRILNGVTRTVGTGATDSSGTILFFLDPDISHTGQFIKSGFTTNTFNFFPTTDTKLVIMGITGGDVPGSNISINSSYIITPTNQSLNNNTDFTFGFDVMGEGITLISMNISNSNGGQLLFQSNAGVGFISGVVNTGNLSRIVGTYIITSPDETLSLQRSWIVGVEFIGDYSLFRQMSLYLDYGFKEFFQYLIIFGTLMAIIIFMSSGNILDNSESKVMVILGVLWAFSIVGWLNNPVIVGSTGIAQFGKQYGIAIISTAAGSVFVFRRVFV